MRIKSSIIAIFFLSCLPVLIGSANSEYTPDVKHVIGQLRVLKGYENMPEIGGCAVGSAGTRHYTYLLKEYIAQKGKISDFVAMIEDESPLVRLVGAQLLASEEQILILRDKYFNELGKDVHFDESALLKEEMKLRKEILEKYTDDTTEVSFIPCGCGISRKTVGEIIQMLINNPKLFEP